MIETLETSLLQSWPDDTPAPRSLQFTRLGSLKTRAKEAALTFVVHTDWQPQPRLTIKAVKDVEFESLVEVEHRLLEDLQSLPSSSLGRTVPRALALRRVEGTLVSIRAFLDGGPLLGYFRQRGNRRHRSRVMHETTCAIEWYRAFDEATRDRRKSVSAEEYVGSLRSRYESLWGLSEAERNLFDRVAGRLAGSSIELGPSHGDFCDGNLITLDDGVGVIDWTHYHPEAPPLSDLVNLLITRRVRPADIDCPGSLLPLYRLEDRKWFATYCQRALRDEALRRGWPDGDTVSLTALAVAFAATRSEEEIGPRRSPMQRRATFFKDLSLWAGESAAARE